MEYYIKFKKGGYTVVDAESANDALWQVKGEVEEIRPYADVIKKNNFERDVNGITTKLVNQRLEL